MENRPVRLVSVSGPGHSGTTLLASMIGNHEKVHLITYETGWFLNSRDNYLEALNHLKSFSNENYQAPIIVEKTPRHVYHISRIAELLPDTRFIVTVRHPLDVLASLLIRYQNMNTALDRTISDLEAIDKIKQRKDVIIVHYENLIETPSETIKSVCKHIDLIFSQDILKWHKNPPNWFGAEPALNEGIGEEAHVSRRAWQVQQPLFDGRGRYLRVLDSNQYEVASKALGRHVKEWGYSL
jgi:hypothetical protein